MAYPYLLLEVEVKVMFDAGHIIEPSCGSMLTAVNCYHLQYNSTVQCEKNERFSLQSGNIYTVALQSTGCYIKIISDGLEHLRGGLMVYSINAD